MLSLFLSLLQLTLFLFVLCPAALRALPENHGRVLFPLGDEFLSSKPATVQTVCVFGFVATTSEAKKEPHQPPRLKSPFPPLSSDDDGAADDDVEDGDFDDASDGKVEQRTESEEERPA